MITNKRHLIKGFLLILLSGSSQFVNAQLVNAQFASANVDYFEMDLEQLMQVNVTGSTLREESLKTVPSSVTVFTRDQLNSLGVDYLYELLNLVPGYQFTRTADSPSGYTFSSRGRRSGASAREVLLVVDGRIFIDPRSGGIGGSPFFPLEKIQRVEIIRGPGSAIYGSGAFNGVINIITRTGENAIKLAAGSQDSRDARALFFHQGQDWEANLFAHAHRNNGEDYVVIDPFTQTQVQTNDPRESFDIDLDLRKGNTHVQAAYFRAQSDNFYVGESIRNDFNKTDQTFKQLSVEQTFKLADSVNSRVFLNYIENEQVLSFAILPDNALASISEPPSNEALLAEGILAGKSYQISINNDWAISSKASAQFGVEWRDNHETRARANSNYNFIQLLEGDYPVDYYGGTNYQTLVGSEGSRESLGLYSQYLRDLTNKTNLTIGVRYDHFPEIGEHFSPRLGLVHQLNEIHSIKLLYGEAFRAPSLSETDLMNNPFLVGNPNLNHEIVNTWDLIWMGSWKKTSISVDGFYIQYDNPISTGAVGPIRTYINGDDEESRGIEFEASHQINGRWLVRGTYTYLNKLPDSAFREADKLASILANYQHGQWSWNIASVFHSERQILMDSGSRLALDNYWYANTKLRYQINKSYEVSLQAKNLFDKALATPAQGAGIVDGVPLRGREWRLGLEWTL